MTKLLETKPSHIKLLYQLLYDTHQILTFYNIKYWTIGGTLLGAVRNKGIIPWDDDSDIGIMNTDIKSFLKLRSIFKKCGYTIIEDFFGFKIFYSERKKIPNFPYSFPFLDVFIYKKIQGKIKPAFSSVRKTWPKDWFMISEINKLVLVPFGSFSLFAPNKTERYFSTLYGDDWNKIAYREYDHAKEQEVEKVKVELTSDMRKPAKPTDKVKDRRCILNLTKKICKNINPISNLL